MTVPSFTAERRADEPGKMNEMNGSLQAQAPSVPSEQADKPVVALDPALFWCNPREGEFYVSVRVEATLHETVSAATIGEARSKIVAMIEAEELDVCGSDVDEARIEYVRPELPMYLIHRPGTTITGTSRIGPNDEPREPRNDHERRTYTRPPSGTVSA